jgi:hypothetical protein
MIEKTSEKVCLVDPDRIDEFFNAYLTAALWSSTDNADESGCEPLDRNYDVNDIDPETLARMRADCIEFLNHDLGGRLIRIAERLESEGKWSLSGGAGCSAMAYAGHDFYLTRQGHGCGYWDGDWPRGIAEGLDKLAQEFGTFDLYVGDDGLVYGC